MMASFLVNPKEGTMTSFTSRKKAFVVMVPRDWAAKYLQTPSLTFSLSRRVKWPWRASFFEGGRWPCLWQKCSFFQIRHAKYVPFEAPFPEHVAMARLAHKQGCLHLGLLLYRSQSLIYCIIAVKSAKALKARGV